MYCFMPGTVQSAISLASHPILKLPSEISIITYVLHIGKLRPREAKELDQASIARERQRQDANPNLPDTLKMFLLSRRPCCFISL